jgi:hypothetical protein
MDNQEVLVLAIKGMVSEQPEEIRNRFAECRSRIEDILVEYKEVGLLALALIGAEIASDKEDKILTLG